MNNSQTGTIQIIEELLQNVDVMVLALLNSSKQPLGRVERAKHEALSEVRRRVRDLKYCMVQMKRHAWLGGKDPLPGQEQDTFFTFDEILRFHLEAFYNTAWRIVLIIRNLSESKWDPKGVRMVRNDLMEHCEKGELKENPVLINSLTFDEIQGPVLKGMRWVDQSGTGMPHDRGLYINAVEFLKELLVKIAGLD